MDEASSSGVIGPRSAVGRRHEMLFTDAANRTSNGVYERLGFEPVAEVVEAELRVAHEAS